MNNFQLVSTILEQVNNDHPIESVADIKNQPEILAIRKKAEDIRVKADLLRAKNQIAKAALDNEKIKYQSEKQKAEQKKKQTVTVSKQQASDSQSLDSGDPINSPSGATQEEMYEDILEPSDTQTSVNEENETELSAIPGEEENSKKKLDGEESVNVEIAGSVPQSREDAEIARLQAQTREIQARIGEYTPPGGAQENTQEDMMDPNQTQMGMDPNQAQVGMDPAVMGMMTPQKKPDPLKGFGDATDPHVGMMGGMGTVDPMTGMPTESEPSKTPSAIGRLFLLKKMYYRLALLDKILSNSSDVELSELAKITSEAFEIFRIISQNLKCYKEKIDEIIVDYYILIRDIASNLENHYKKQSLGL